MKKTSEDSQLAVQTAEPSVALMLQGALTSIQAGEVTGQHVEVLSRMMDLYERNEKRVAEKDFAAALVDLQGETIRVQATKAVDQKADGSCRYRFAPYEEIMATVQPMLTRHGFSITFDTEEGDARLTSVCTLTHKSGHSRSNKFAVRYGKPPGSSDAQGDMSTKSYAKRGALCDALNITVEHDDDARMIGKPIGKALGEELQARVKACGADEQAFLKFAGAANYESVGDERWDALDAMLKRKESGKAERKSEEPVGGEQGVIW
jgi:hypothetical protein